MIKVRVFLFLLTILVVGTVGMFVSYYARGYRLDIKTLGFQPNGILVLKSEPDGASIFINGELKTATNTTVSLSPGTYDVDIKKEGYLPWSKRLTIEKEIVTQATVSLFKNIPSLSPVTFSGAQNPIVSDDGTSIAFQVPYSADTAADKAGLWTIDTFNLPLGFLNDPKRITDGDLSDSSYAFSPDGRQILLTTSNGIFLLDSGSFTPQSQRINVASRKNAILSQWQIEKKAKDESLTKSLPADLVDILTRKSGAFIFSPDEQMIVYTASASGTIPENLVKQLPGASTQKQERVVQQDRTYVYDIKEDRNFLISDQPASLTNHSVNQTEGPPAIRWMPSSKHLLFAQSGQIVIMDYDGTNRQIVYSGSYNSPFAFPYSNTTKLLILTNLGGASASPNLYSLTVK